MSTCGKRDRGGNRGSEGRHVFPVELGDQVVRRTLREVPADCVPEEPGHLLGQRDVDLVVVLVEGSEIFRSVVENQHAHHGTDATARTHNA